MIIIGAGLSGLLAGAMDRRAMLFERQATLPHNHHAVLRFREDKIGRALNLPFRRVRVLKAIIVDGRPTAPNPQNANWYAKKVTGSIVDRSILDVTPVDRFIAPKDLIAQLGAMCAGRITYNYAITPKLLAELPRPLVSTIPLPAMLELVGMDAPGVFESAPIRVVKFRVPGADVFQTIYFPAPEQMVYRATITGDELMMECVGAGPMSAANQEEVLWAFGLRAQDVELLDAVNQRLGKILPLPSTARKATLLALTRKCGVYSLGRFACWRNSLLDDVYEDWFRIRRMMELGEYDVIRGVIQ